MRPSFGMCRTEDRCSYPSVFRVFPDGPKASFANITVIEVAVHEFDRKTTFHTVDELNPAVHMRLLHH